MAGLKVKVNTSRSDGDLGGEDSDAILRDILKELQKSGKGAATERKLGFSGILGAAGAGGFGKLIATPIGAAVAAAIALALASKEAGKDFNINPEKAPAGEKYIRGTEDGEDIIKRVNDKTGDILEIITLEEATERKILNERGKLASEAGDVVSLFDNIVVIGRGIAKALLGTEEDEVINEATTENIRKVNQEIFELKKKQALRLAREAASSPESILAIGRGPLRQSVAEKIAYENAMKKEQTPFQQFQDEFYLSSPLSKAIDLSYRGDT